MPAGRSPFLGRLPLAATVTGISLHNNRFLSFCLFSACLPKSGVANHYQTSLGLFH